MKEERDSTPLAGRKCCTICYATRAKVYSWSVELPAEATIADALAAARRAAPATGEVPWESAPVGVFGELRGRQEIPAHGDRIEIYRPLPHDPRARRRERVSGQRRLIER